MSEKDRLEWLANQLLKKSQTKKERSEENERAENFKINLRKRKRFQKFRYNKGKYIT